jgi:hypothetical protein
MLNGKNPEKYVNILCGKKVEELNVKSGVTHHTVRNYWVLEG